MGLKKTLLLLFCLLYTIVSLHAELKPSAMLLPIHFDDFAGGGVRKALDNHVRSELALYYELKTEKEIQQAREVAIDEVSSKECTEEACVKAMGNILQVEYIFNLEIIGVGEDWDLNVTQTDQDGLRNPRNELCKNCDLTKARKTLSEILLALRPGGVNIQRGKASLHLKSTPKAQVFLNGIKQGKTPLTLPVDARKTLDVMLIAEGYNDFTESFTLKPGEKREKNITMARKRGRLRLESTPSGAKISIDGRPELNAKGKIRKTPADLRLVYGEHSFTLTRDGYTDYTETVDINRTNLGKVNWELFPQPGRLVVRVPSEYKNASIFMDDTLLGTMDGEFVKTFEVSSNIKHIIRARAGNFESTAQNVQIKADGSKKVELENFTRRDSNSTEISNPSDNSSLPKKIKRIRVGLLYNNVSASLLSSSKTIDLDYNAFGVSFQHRIVKLELVTGNGKISNGALDHFAFYDSDNSKWVQVDSTTITIFRFIISPTYKARWLLTDFGHEQVTILLGTDSGDELKISLLQPIIALGFQNLGEKGYFQIKYGFSLVNKYASDASAEDSSGTGDVSNREVFDYRSGLAIGFGLLF